MNLLAKKPALVAEVLGLFLVLTSIGWQIFLEDKVKDIALDTEMYRINQKLDNLWMYVSGIGQEVLHDEPVRSINYSALSDAWNRLQKVEKSVKAQKDWMGTVRGILFFIGSLLVSAGRFFELKMRVENEGKISNGTS